MTLRRKHFSPSYDAEERDRRAHRRYLKILREVKEECGDTTLSSDEEGNALYSRKDLGVNGEKTFFFLCEDSLFNRGMKTGLQFYWLHANEHGNRTT